MSTIEGLDADLLAGKFQTLERLHAEVENPPEVMPDAGGGARAIPGPRVPPGVAEILAEDETQRALEATRGLVAYVRQVILDESQQALWPSSFAGAQVIVDLEDQFLIYAIWDDLTSALEQLGAVVRRYDRVIQTGHQCIDVTCKGSYIVPAHGGKLSQDLVCDACSGPVAYDVWSKWPQRVSWLTPEHAAKRLGVSVNSARIRASRERWRKTGTGRDVRYHVNDVDRMTRA